MFAIEMVMYFVTEQEFFDFFDIVLYCINKILKLDRLNAMSEFENDEKNGQVEIPYITTYGEEILNTLYKQNVKENCEITIPSFDDLYNEYIYKITSVNDLRKSAMQNFAPHLFSALKADSIFQILFNIFIERSVLFVSENLNLLTSSMYFM